MKLLVYLIVFSIIYSCNERLQNEKKNTQKDHYEMTVILSDKKNSFSEWTQKTIITDSVISIDSTVIDIYFSNKIVQLPYYLPTNGIFRDSIKDRECDLKIYPANVKCYEYDNLQRVIKMSVDGSGTMGFRTYKYDSLNRIIEIKRNSVTYLIKYLKNSRFLTELTVSDGLLDNVINKRLEIRYE